MYLHARVVGINGMISRCNPPASASFHLGSSGSEPNDRCVHESMQLANCQTFCTFTWTRQTHGSLHVYMHLMCAYKRAVIRCLMCSCNWAMTDVCMKMCSKRIF